MRDCADAAVNVLAWFHCFNGIAGDMAFGALVDAGADIDEILAIVRRIPVTGWEVEAEPVLRCGLASTKLHVHAKEDSIVRTAGHIVGLVEEARLPVRVRDRTLAVFGALAEAEGRLHRRPPTQVHFHEVGGIDAIVDVVGTCAALEVLDVDEVYASVVAVGTGMIRAAHGLLPNPPPAVVELLRGAPTIGRDSGVEMTTPTGAALLAGMAVGFGSLPPMTVRATGYGAGTRDLDGTPNVTQVVIGDEIVARSEGETGQGQPMVVLEVNVDDATGEVLAHAIAAALEAGAADAWVIPAVMKKGRPGHVVAALVDGALAASVAATLTGETGAIGIRGRPVERWAAPRAIDAVDVAGVPVRVKVSPGRVKAEFDDAARVARLYGLPLREVQRRAEHAWHEHHLGLVPDEGTGDAPDGPDDEPA